ncbi:hypothetical protein I553_8653 [Mycobacterium xenopi 4042]|uniref:Uncharacterized protein n=1 Tax=Mycobacterium xenopi 4042 TaxID=1299334 RepID=X8CMW3_MYCXE|nr:hypothetical protein I553_8653 [Mycobacterium xenopi 4042]
MRTSLDGDTDQYQPVADFLTVASELQRGQKAGFTLSAPVRSLTAPSLAIERPGVYPLLVNVNGTPTTVHRPGSTTRGCCFRS